MFSKPELKEFYVNNFARRKVGARLIIGALEFAQKHFFKSPSDTIKDFHYVDWKPRLSQLSSKVARTFWNSRREGFFAGLTSFATIGMASFVLRNSFQDISFLGVKGSEITKNLCSFIFFEAEENCPSSSLYIATLATASVAMGCLVTFCCGAYDLINEYVAHCRSMASKLKPAFHTQLRRNDR